MGFLCQLNGIFSFLSILEVRTTRIYRVSVCDTYAPNDGSFLTVRTGYDRLIYVIIVQCQTKARLVAHEKASFRHVHYIGR